MIYEVYTDGATSNNGYKGSKGGYAFAIYKDKKLIHYNSYHADEVTNNYCELMAVLEALKYCESFVEDHDKIIIYSDSAYFCNCYEKCWYKKWKINGWLNSKKQPVANKEIWKKIIPYFEDYHFNFIKVKGHANDERNNFVDKLAVEAKGV